MRVPDVDSNFLIISFFYTIELNQKWSTDGVNWVIIFPPSNALDVYCQSGSDVLGSAWKRCTAPCSAAKTAVSFWKRASSMARNQYISVHFARFLLRGIDVLSANDINYGSLRKLGRSISARACVGSTAQDHLSRTTTRLEQGKWFRT